MENLTPLLEEVLAPIPGDNPAGSRIDPNEDFDFVTIKNEVDKMSLVSGSVDQEKLMEQSKSLVGTQQNVAIKGAAVSSGTQYALIVSASRNILKNKSKNLLVIAYMNVGLAYDQGATGLAEGFGALHIFAENYWDQGYPEKKKPRLRGAALNFMMPKLINWAERYKPQSGDEAAFEAIKTHLSFLSGFWMKELNEHAPPTTEFKVGLEKLAKQVAAPPTPPPPPPDLAETTTDAPTPEIAPTNEVAPSPAPSVSLPSSFGTVDDAIMAVPQLCAAIRAADRRHPASYRMMRLAMWAGLTSEPANDMLPAPEPHRYNYYTGELANQDLATIIEEVEGLMQEFPYPLILDLQRILVQALEKAGSDFVMAKEAILTELALMLQKVPGLPALRFNDGTPFASPITQTWIEDVVVPFIGAGGGGGGGNLMITAGEEEAELVAAFKEAQKTIEDVGAATAVAKLQAGMEADLSGRARFRRRLMVAILCSKVGFNRIALPLLETLDSEGEAIGLARWEPALALDVWLNQYRCYKALLSEANEDRQIYWQEKMETVLDKMSRTDVRFALTAIGERPKSISKNTLPQETLTEIDS